MTPTEIKAWREERGLSQREMADVLGVRQATVSRWESGERTPPPYLRLALEMLDTTEENDDD